MTTHTVGDKRTKYLGKKSEIGRTGNINKTTSWSRTSVARYLQLLTLRSERRAADSLTYNLPLQMSSCQEVALLCAAMLPSALAESRGEMSPPERPSISVADTKKV